MKIYMKRLITIFVLISLFVYGCAKSGKGGDLYTISVNDDNIEKVDNYDISTLFEDSLTIIPLQVTDECLLVNSSSFSVVNNYIYYQDATTREVCRFDMQGNFLNKIGKYGRGPGELMASDHFSVIGDSLLMMDMSMGNFCFYDLYGTGYREYELTPFVSTTYFEVIDNNLYLMTNNAEMHNLIVQDLRSDNRTYYLPADSSFFDSYACWETDNQFFVNQRGLYFRASSLNDTIFVINDGIVKPAFRIDFGKDKMPDEYIAEHGAYNLIVNAMKDNYFTDFMMYGIVDDKLFADYTIGKSNYALLHNFADNKSVATNCFVLKSDGTLPVHTYRIANNTLLFSAGASELLKTLPILLEHGKFSNAATKQKLQNLLANLNEDSNPVIFVKSFKF